MIATNLDEGFSTIDTALIDTTSGKVKFIKAGAPAGFIKRGSKIEMIKGGSLPVGIIDEISPKVTEKTVVGDMVIMVTDGVMDAFQKAKTVKKCSVDFYLKQEQPITRNGEKNLKKAKEK